MEFDILETIFWEDFLKSAISNVAASTEITATDLFDVLEDDESSDNVGNALNNDTTASAPVADAGPTQEEHSSAEDIASNSTAIANVEAVPGNEGPDVNGTPDGNDVTGPGITLPVMQPDDGGAARHIPVIVSDRSQK